MRLLNFVDDPCLDRILVRVGLVVPRLLLQVAHAVLDLSGLLAERGDLRLQGVLVAHLDPGVDRQELDKNGVAV